MSKYFFPELTEIVAQTPYCLRTHWNTGEVLWVDVEKVLRSTPELAPILAPDVFVRAHIGEWGGTVEWFDSELGADNVYAWAKEQAGQISHEMFDNWIRRNNLSLTAAAAALGMSRRMMSYYRTAQKPVPRHVWLACLGWEGARDFANDSSCTFASKLPHFFGHPHCIKSTSGRPVTRSSGRMA